MLPISPSSRPNIVSAFAYAFILLIFQAYAEEATAQKIILPALRLQQTRSDPDPSTTPKPQKKKGLTPLRSEEAPEGSRVTITYNAPVNDYSAYRRGDRFVIVIPKADAPRVRSGMRGRSFDGVQVEKRGDDAVLSFRIQPGVKARIDQQYNRLEVVFSPSDHPTPNAASNPKLKSSASALAAASKAPQAAQAPGVSQQRLLANHNSTALNTNQPINEKASSDSSVSTPATGTQPGATPATSDSSLAPSTDSATPVRPPADSVAAGQPTPAVSPAAASTSLGMAVTRYWLQLLIAALLLASAYAIIAARRKAERSKRIAAAPADAAGEVEAETIVPRREGVEELTGSDEEEAEPVHESEKGIETEVAAETTPEVLQNDVAEDARPETPAFDVQPETSVLISAGAAPVEQREDHESPALRSTEAGEERLAHEAIEQDEPLARPNRGETLARGAKESVVIKESAVIKEPFTADLSHSRIPSTILRYLDSEDAYERAAGVLDLAELGSDDAFRRIGAAFDDPEELVRDSAARALFNVSADRADSFKRIMRESSPERRRRIGAAIASSGMAGEAISDLSSESGERAYDALLVLSLMAKAGEVQSLIETIEEHSNTAVRLALVKLLALSEQPEILSAFRHLATRDSLPVAVRSSIMEAIYQLNNQRPFASSATHQ